MMINTKMTIICSKGRWLWLYSSLPLLWKSSNFYLQDSWLHYCFYIRFWSYSSSRKSQLYCLLPSLPDDYTELPYSFLLNRCRSSSSCPYKHYSLLYTMFFSSNQMSILLLAEECLSPTLVYPSIDQYLN